jgi:hypothetical protein
MCHERTGTLGNCCNFDMKDVLTLLHHKIACLGGKSFEAGNIKPATYIYIYIFFLSLRRAF